MILTALYIYFFANLIIFAIFDWAAKNHKPDNKKESQAQLEWDANWSTIFAIFLFFGSIVILMSVFRRLNGESDE